MSTNIWMTNTHKQLIIKIQSLQDGAVMCRNQANFDEYNIV